MLFDLGMSEVKLKLIPYSAPPSPRVNVAVNIPAGVYTGNFRDIIPIRPTTN